MNDVPAGVKVPAGQTLVKIMLRSGIVATVKASFAVGNAGNVFASARAYCGAAHGRIWPLDPALRTPDDVVLSFGGGSFPYRLVRDLRLGRAARDGEGNLLYLPSYPDILAMSALLVRLSL